MSKTLSDTNRLEFRGAFVSQSLLGTLCLTHPSLASVLALPKRQTSPELACYWSTQTARRFEFDEGELLAAAVQLIRFHYSLVFSICLTFDRCPSFVGHESTLFHVRMTPPTNAIFAMIVMPPSAVDMVAAWRK